MSKFANKFFKVLNEQDDEREAMLSTLDKDTDPAQFDTDTETPASSDTADLLKLNLHNRKLW